MVDLVQIRVYVLFLIRFPSGFGFAIWFSDLVDHCHILAHEDRGIMQLVEVVDNKTMVKHH
jgi:FtsP/CotA-like multicopper oxidase with cupredoxin domain